MAFLNSLTLILCLQSVIAMISIPTNHCNTIKPEAYKLIENICRKTPNYNVSIQYLRWSSSADVTGLALIMMNVMKARATTGLNQIHGLQRGAIGSVQKALSFCADGYNAILVGEIPQAIEALQKGDPKFAEEATNWSANIANNCERQFGGHSPLTQQNNAIYDVASVMVAIVRNLL